MFKRTLITRSLAAGVAIGAASFPAAAQARFELNPPVANQPAQAVSAPAVQQRLDHLQTSVQQRFAAEGGWPSTGSSVPSTAASEGFQWGDAGIGAAGTVVLLGAGAGAAAAMRRRHTHRAVTG